jgi:hypothetical protein
MKLGTKQDNDAYIYSEVRIFWFVDFFKSYGPLHLDFLYARHRRDVLWYGVDCPSAPTIDTLCGYFLVYSVKFVLAKKELCG